MTTSMQLVMCVLQGVREHSGNMLFGSQLFLGLAVEDVAVSEAGGPCGRWY